MVERHLVLQQLVETACVARLRPIQRGDSVEQREDRRPNLGQIIRKPAGQRERLGRRQPPDAIDARQPDAGAAHSLLDGIQYGTLSLLWVFFRPVGEKSTHRN